MNLYAESSAILTWLLSEPRHSEVRSALGQAGTILVSDLTLIECDRVLHRVVADGRLTETEAANRRGHLNQAATHWAVLRLFSEVIERARRPFPVEPIRTLDAIHLASALTVRPQFPDLALLSLDQRVRDCGRQLGFEILPA